MAWRKEQNKTGLCNYVTSKTIDTSKSIKAEHTGEGPREIVFYLFRLFIELFTE
jgi:hypothetical protein